MMYDLTGIEKGTVIVISERNRSLDNGKTWHVLKSTRVIEDDEAFVGIQGENGPSESGFWGNCNEIRSGHITKYCSKYDGNRWRSMRRQMG
ncbi:MAG: hypothetical protein FVQ79_08300 [Planctomycetes bacterium]|nr:hypothetical protein [Planctomycetota bacterium]